MGYPIESHVAVESAPRQFARIDRAHCARDRADPQVTDILGKYQEARSESEKC